jgi:hypothetical protein
MTVREWLRVNDYKDLEEQIAEVVEELKAAGSKERRSWGFVLSGGKEGKPLIVANREFPVLASAQEAYRKPVTPNAIRNSPDEKFPTPRRTGRWPRKKRLPRKAKRLAQKANRSPHAQAS